MAEANVQTKTTKPVFTEPNPKAFHPLFSVAKETKIILSSSTRPKGTPLLLRLFEEKIRIKRPQAEFAMTKIKWPLNSNYNKNKSPTKKLFSGNKLISKIRMS